MIIRHSKFAKAKLGKQKLSVAARQRMMGARITRVSAIQSTLDEPALASASVLVVNELSGERVFEKNGQSVTPIASITKLMTAMVVLDQHLPMNELITISEEDVDTVKNTSSRLAVGTTLSRSELMLLALMASENRAAAALARTSPGGTAAFVARMNRTAASLGMKHTRFSDSTGLRSENVSTAEDLVRMVEAAHSYPEIRQFSTTGEYNVFSNATGREIAFRNTNPLVREGDWQIGISKTGYISESGKCLVMHTTINDTPLVIVLLDSNGRMTRVVDAIRVKKWLESSPAAKLRAG
ncbi:serine hydrolase [Parachitinimonas caeni]|uniref:Serine hydrolase n=1 Tax=Parachitinimonas caeni TaxID=3031301 RepID=A0ABT7E169_9NEIS|nr:serine hydrolase [Parachitinimonas caeni]MDK2126067.1 serine hydrolase [Parachitinimonas caeni]